MTKIKIEASKNEGMIEGIYDSVEIVPEKTKKETRIENIIEAIKANKFYVLPVGMNKNTVYSYLKSLKVLGVKVSYSKTKDVDGEPQFVFFAKKD